MNDRDVADYLLANPEFFARHAELLAAVRLANPHGKAAISLQERQMEMLRDKNKLLERRLAELLRYGHENDGLAAKFGRWTARVIAERDAHALPRAIAGGLADVFDVPQTALRIWDVAEAYAQADFARNVGEEVRLFANSLVTPYCGANSGFEAAQWLAPVPAAPEAADRADGAATAVSASGVAASIALIALRAPEAGDGAPPFGLLVLGSPDPRRFHDGMGTDFLTQIGTLASAALTRLLPH
ncbi:DUF484 family protein [Burkholderia glumae]|uniref:DUF484 family protein n=1 Tax=Burkholderia glumae TaxID=337 RepID=A0AAP9Y2G8_BURGL|nr:DUF484 family protein [Burkholderia glumae]ACR30433.1 3',5'-cyclic-nucleotide phosphodiesterase [Burkholderia glumae BGR1]AJY66766.1 hypothetical protein KS03_832 [Burkholderia glumae LMG 2196 = ATCC 33617]KHJ62740.1 hypothetical protein NCPPB3923_11925 [Burkholderia glumae]MCM2481915.1 DUF484 family protein [Burkholderia glumae]MCM2507942.1 DUF484 family protein [Burkholderia glumae]